MIEEGERLPQKIVSTNEKIYHVKVYIVLLIRHPFIDPELITKKIGLIPFRYQRFGEPRMTPKGKALPGLWKNSSWSWQCDREDKRSFFDSVNLLVTELESHNKFLSDLRLQGGNIYVIVNILGKENIGDVLSWQIMEKMVNLKIDLGIEVFPDEREH